MSDCPEYPYEKAIEETAKTAGKALEIVQSISPAVATAYNAAIGDRLSAYRERNRDAFRRKTKKIIEERDLKETMEVPLQIAVPLLEKAQSETREAIQDLYAALLANAMDEHFSQDVRPEFIATVSQLQPIDAMVLKFAMERRVSPTTRVFASNHIYDALKQYRHTAIEVSLENLRKLSCIGPHAQGMVLTPFGVELMMACHPHTKEHA